MVIVDNIEIISVSEHPNAKLNFQLTPHTEKDIFSLFYFIKVLYFTEKEAFQLGAWPHFNQTSSVTSNYSLGIFLSTNCTSHPFQRALKDIWYDGTDQLQALP